MQKCFDAGHPEVPAASTLYILNLLPHYRSGVFTELLTRGKGRTAIVGGHASDDSARILEIGTETIPTPRLRNRRLGPLLWQSGVLRMVVRHSNMKTVVFTGDWKIISTWIAAAICRARGARVLFWTIGWHRANTSRRRELIRLSFYRLADALLVYGHRSKKIGTQLGYPPQRIHVVGNSFPVAVSRRPERTIESREIVCVGRLTAAKRLDLLISAVASLPVNRRPIVTLVGEGPESMALEAQARAEEVDVRFLGAVHDPTELARVYESARITVIPGAAGLTVVQSLAFGVPVITHGDLDRQMPEVEAVTPGITGEFVDRDNIPKLAAAIEAWLDLSEEDYLRRTVECKRTFRESWTPERHAERIADAVGRAR